MYSNLNYGLVFSDNVYVLIVDGLLVYGGWLEYDVNNVMYFLNNMKWFVFLECL